MGRISILQMIDTLQIGGAEKVAVNIANGLPKERYQVFLCVTRLDGPLSEAMKPDVTLFYLNRRFLFDLMAFIRFIRFIREQHILIMHAHSYSLFFAVVAKMFHPKSKIVWHDHYGVHAISKRSVFLHRMFAKHVDGVISVNRQLADWAVNSLGLSRQQVWYIPNFVVNEEIQVINNLPGQAGYRIVCIANLRPQKDHRTLIQAMKLVVQQEPRAHLILIGADPFKEYANEIWQEIKDTGLANHITWMGERQDVQSVLRGCDIGVLSSVSEGFPLSLLEYGTIGLPVVSTLVGECIEILDQGNAGLLISPHDPVALADSLLSLLHDPSLRERLARNFSEHIRSKYSMGRMLAEVEKMYYFVLAEDV